MLKNLSLRTLILGLTAVPLTSCATTIEWEGKPETHAQNYMTAFAKFRKKICVPNAEAIFSDYLTAYRGKGYWIPELRGDVDVETIRALLPEYEKKLAWISSEKAKLVEQRRLPENVTAELRSMLKTLLNLKRYELSEKEAEKVRARKESLALLSKVQFVYGKLVERVSFLSNYGFPVDHLKNRKVYDEHREQVGPESVKMANYTFLYRKLLEDGAYNKDRTGSDIYLRTTLDTLHYELRQHGFYITEDARYDLEFVLAKIDAEIKRGKERLIERLDEWEDRTARALAFYRSLTLPENQQLITVNGEKTTRNRELIKEHNQNTERLKKFVYQKQAEVYSHWLGQNELNKAIFVLETILMNEVGGVDGDDALERMDVARVVMNRREKPKYLTIGPAEFIYPYLEDVATTAQIKNEKWLNALFKQGEFSFTYYYMNGVAHIFCPDIAPGARRLRKENIDIALRVLKEKDSTFEATRYFSRASMIGRIHMDSVWEDYVNFPERPGLLAKGQKRLLKRFNAGDFTYLYSFQDPQEVQFQVIEIKGKTYVLGEKKGVKLFFKYRNPHYFKYFSRLEPQA